jgi:hypothetical protein
MTVLSALLPGALRAATAPRIQLSPTLVAPLDTVTVSGSGFTPGDSFSVYANVSVRGKTHRVQIDDTTNASGTFSDDLTVPASTDPGLYTVTATDADRRSASSQSLHVLQLVNLTAGGGGPTAYVIAGRRVFLRGLGFRAGESVKLSATFPLYDGDSSIIDRTAYAGPKGGFWNLLFPVPFDARAGKVTLTAMGATSTRVASANVVVVYRPTISLSPSSARPGRSSTVHGAGFVPGAAVKVSVTIPRTGSSAKVLVAAARADRYGGFTASLALPSNARPGTYTVTASADGLHASARLTV